MCLYLHVFPSWFLCCFLPAPASSLVHQDPSSCRPRLPWD
jgi:hypothetical protein